MQRTYIKFKEYIEHIRHHTRSVTYQEFELLVKKWERNDNHTKEKSKIGN